MQQSAAIVARLVFVLPICLPLAVAAAEPPATNRAAQVQAGSLNIGSMLDFDCGPLGCERRSPPRRLQFGATQGLGATLVEFRNYALPGHPARAHHGIGVRSHRLESALNEIGIEARHCLAPVVRMHTKLSSSFDLSGTLWVYLRCSVE